MMSCPTADFGFNRVEQEVSEFSIEARDVSCERDHRTLFDGISFRVGPGQVLQIAGANGSGKTTLLRVLVGVSSAFDGEILWNGSSITATSAHYRSQFLYLGHAPAVTLNLTPLENLRWFFQLNQKVESQSLLQALDQVGLRGYEEVPAYRLSAGQQRRIALARLLVSRAPLWVLDEPFTAIDLRGVGELESILCGHARRGGGVILTTHHPLNLDIPFARVELQGTTC